MLRILLSSVLLALIVLPWIPCSNGVGSEAGVIELQPTEDVHIMHMSEVYKLSVYDLEYLRVCKKLGGVEEEELGSVHPYRLYVSFLKFDVSGIPADAKVSSAELKIYVYELEEPYEVGVHRCLDTSWSEKDTEWAILPPVETQPTSTVLVDKTGWHSLDAKAALMEALPAGELALAIQIEDYYPTRGLWFWSRTAPDPEVRPRLTITLSTPTSISCSVSSELVRMGEQIAVKGAISGPEGPLHLSTMINLTYVKPDGTRVEKTVGATDGEYADSYTPDAAGRWTVSASWPGDASHEGSVSPTLSFSVEETSPLERYSIQLLVLVVAVVAIVVVSLAAKRRRR